MQHRVSSGKVALAELDNIHRAAPVFGGWFAAFFAAACRGDHAALAGLAGPPLAAAAKLEAEVSAKAIASWKAWLGPQAPKHAAAPICPGRGAFRWLRGIAGWTKSAIGPDAANESLPDDGGILDDAAPWCDGPIDGE